MSLQYFDKLRTLDNNIGAWKVIVWRPEDKIGQNLQFLQHTLYRTGGLKLFNKKIGNIVIFTRQLYCLCALMLCDPRDFHQIIEL